jgi:hypothetical protein
MSGEDFSFSFSLPAQPSAPPRPARYIARPFEAHPVGDETLILASGSEDSVQAPIFYARMLAHCDHFQTLDEHTQAVMRDFGLPAEQQTGVRQGLAGLVERGLLQDEKTVFDGLGASESQQNLPESPLRSLCIRTCNRPADLQRLLASLERHLDSSALERILVLDDAKDANTVAETAAVVSTASTSSPVKLIHVTRGRRADWIQQMSDQAGADAEQLRWLIEGDEDDPEASYGANLNLALLLTAGERFLMIDDDATLDPFVLTPPKDSLSLRAAHEFEVQFPDTDRPETDQFPTLDVNPLLAHESALGASVGTLSGRHGLQDGHLLAEISPQMIFEFSARPRVRLTTNGTLGDSGTGSMLWQYSLPPEQLSGWLESEQTYRRQAFSRRVARSTNEVQIASSVSLMTTTLTGVDNRELLLPVPAKGRGEDLIFGVGVRFLYPGTPCCALPWMLPHRMHSRRGWDASDLKRRQSVGMAGFMASAIEDLAQTPLPQEPFARTAVLAAWMEHLACMSESELISQLRRHLLEKRADMANFVRETFSGLSNPPVWLQQDFEAIINRHCQVQADDTQRLEALCPTIRKFSTRYGQALATWTEVWRWAASVDVLEAFRE